MKVIGDFNNVSKELKPRKLKPGEKVVYQFLLGVPNTYPNDPAYVKERPILYPEVYGIRLKDRIFDPYKNDYVDIGVVDSWDKDGVIKCKKFPFKAKENHGQWGCSAGNIEQEEMYEFFELSNQNESNPNRDKSVMPVFKRVDVNKEAKEKNYKRTKLEEAIIFTSNMSEKDMREFAAAMNWNELADEEILKGQVKDFAFENPEGFLNAVADDTSIKDKGLLKRAFTTEILKYDVSTHKVLWAKEQQTVAVLDRVDGKNYLDIFYDWILTSKNGNNIMASIKKRINAQIADAKKEMAKEGETQ